jgi:Mlc titration factor MtfA (ptsG expression regulator)
MWNALTRWRRRRILSRTAIPDELWSEAIALRPFVSIYNAGELARLREKVVLFLHAKGIVGARGHEVTPLQRVVIALEACVLVLELDMAFYDGFENVIVYPGEFVPDWEWEDEAGVVHRNDEPMAGEAMPGGPVVLSWPDVAAGADWQSSGMNLVIHEFAHKIDMRGGDADGCPPLHAGMPADVWSRTLTSAYEDFCARMDCAEPSDIDPYAAESPAEFFAVLSEVFFVDPLILRDEYPLLYEQFAAFYRQDPAARLSAREGR